MSDEYVHETGDFYVSQIDTDGGVRVTNTPFYQRRDSSEDESFWIVQKCLNHKDKELVFGPVSVLLSTLLRRRFTIEISSFRFRKSHSVLLVGPGHSYKLSTVGNQQISNCADLTELFRDVTTPIPTYRPTDESRKVVIRKIYEQLPINTLESEDLFGILQQKYPKQQKRPIENIGNQTLQDYVKQQMKQQRKEYHV